MAADLHFPTLVCHPFDLLCLALHYVMAGEPFDTLFDVEVEHHPTHTFQRSISARTTEFDMFIMSFHSHNQNFACAHRILPLLANTFWVLGLLSTKKVGEFGDLPAIRWTLYTIMTPCTPK